MNLVVARALKTNFAAVMDLVLTINFDVMLNLIAEMDLMKTIVKSNQHAELLTLHVGMEPVLTKLLNVMVWCIVNMVMMKVYVAVVVLVNMFATMENALNLDNVVMEEAIVPMVKMKQIAHLNAKVDNSVARMDSA